MGANAPPGSAADLALVEAARAIVADARQQGAQLSQVGLASQLRRGIPHRQPALHWLSAVTGLSRAPGQP